MNIDNNDNNNNNNNNAGFGVRFFAAVLETLLYVLIFLIPLYLVIRSFRGYETIDPVHGLVNIFTFLVVFTNLGLLLYFIYNLYFTSNYGGNIGKLLFGLKVVDQNSERYVDYKTAFYRNWVGYMFSSTLLWLGFLRVITNPGKLAWHDELFNTKVVRTTGTYAGILSLVLVLGLVSFTAKITFDEIKGSRFVQEMIRELDDDPLIDPDNIEV
jgi:uncharacterized RDD family membrane protein YckC